MRAERSWNGGLTTTRSAAGARRLREARRLPVALAAARHDRGDSGTLGILLTIVLTLFLLAALAVPVAGQAGAAASATAASATAANGTAANGTAAADGALTPLDSELFPVPAPLAPNVAFWLSIFTEHTSHQVVLHDEVHVERVYAVLDFAPLDASSLSEVAKERRRRQEIRNAKEKYRDLLQRLAAGERPADSAETERIYALLGAPGAEGWEDDPGRYRRAADRLRTQRGLADHFAEAIERSGRVLPAIERLFAERELPVELTRLPFVESMFQTRALSSAAAGGIWQIMPSTGRRYLKVGSDADERYDPLLAAEAAATILAENHEALGSWPLAITAYNHGKAGMMRAVRRLGSDDIGEIVTRHSGRRFGFASRNFYSEFVAAALAYEHRQRFFPGAEPAPPLAFEEFIPDRYAPASRLAADAEVDEELLRALNPALSREVWEGRMLVPAGYRLRVPAGQGERVAAAYAALPASLKPEHQLGQRYRVRSGDTLSGIARRFGTTVGAIQRANDLRRRDFIRAGQVLRIPPSEAWAAAVAGGGRSSGGYHVVARGETLSRIARRNGVTVAALKGANGLSDNRIYPGQRLRLP